MAYYLSAIVEWFGERIHFTSKYVAHLVTGTCEIERICRRDEGAHSEHMSSQFAKSLRRSKQLAPHSQLIFSRQLFSAKEVLQNILDVKHISSFSDPILVINISLSIEGLSVVNKVYNHLQALKSTAVDTKNNHHGKELERLWWNMQGDEDGPTHISTRTINNLTESSDGTLSEESKKPFALMGDHWSDVGFQGKDPCTDFRGMGLLSLRQLTYFSHFRQANALHVLKVSQHNRRYFPFAATGINITAFVMDLFLETRLHTHLFRKIDILSLYMNSGSSSCGSTSTSPPPLITAKSDTSTNVAEHDSAAVSASDEEHTRLLEEEENKYVIACTEAVHDLYCTLYEEFCALWVEKDPRDIMAFPLIFQEFKSTVRRRYLPV